MSDAELIAGLEKQLRVANARIELLQTEAIETDRYTHGLTKEVLGLQNRLGDVLAMQTQEARPFDHECKSCGLKFFITWAHDAESQRRIRHDLPSLEFCPRCGKPGLVCLVG